MEYGTRVGGFRPGNVVASVIFTLMLLVVSACAHWMLASWLMRAFAPLARRRRALLKVVAFATIVTPLLRWASIGLRDSVTPRLFAFGMIELMVVVLGALPMGVLRGAMLLLPQHAARRPPTPPATGTSRVTASAPSAVTESATSRGTGSAPMAVTATTNGNDGDADADGKRGVDEVASPADERAVGRTLSRRDAIERIAGIAVLGTTTSVLGWGMIRGRHAFELNEIVVKIPGLPRVLDGYSIAQVSDIHVGLFVGERELEEGFARVREAKPDLVVATGDLVDYDPRFVPLMAASLAKLQARDGVVAILGNHDHYTGPQAVLRGLGAAGVKTLVNDALHLRPGDGGGFALLGVNDLTGGHGGGRKTNGAPDVARAIAAAPPDRARILLAHQPNHFKYSAGQVALQLSGHTHGGQVNPGFSPASVIMEFVAGRYERNGTTLYVNRGFGVAGPPTRVGAPPEVTKIVLVSA